MNTARDRVAIILTAAIFGLTYGLSAPLIALQLSDAGLAETLIGLNAAMHALGVLLIAPFLPGLTAWLGMGRTALLALVMAAAVLALFPAVPGLWLWFPLRLALGIASESLFVVSETWVNQITTEEVRARSMAAYTASLSLGFALGPVVLTFSGSAGAQPFLLGSLIALAAAALLLLMRPRPAAIERPPSMTPLRALRLAPLAIAATALNAALETAGLSFLALYAMGLGWTERPATLLISTLMTGAILLQLPIGWLGDRFDRRRLTLILAILSTVGAGLWPAVLATPWLTYPLLFLWGGAFVGIYTLMITLLGSRFQGGELVGLYAILSVSWGIGALLGPPLGGAAMQVATHGLPVFAAAGCAALAFFVAFSRSRS
ncbi:MAG TPA: MFS transporter [Roseomonas sp.]|nr:MFS transporter [Roseomonas sp.]